MSVNTKGEKVERCKICKYHTKTSFSQDITPDTIADIVLNTSHIIDKLWSYTKEKSIVLPRLYLYILREKYNYINM